MNVILKKNREIKVKENKKHGNIYENNATIINFDFSDVENEYSDKNLTKTIYLFKDEISEVNFLKKIKIEDNKISLTDDLTRYEKLSCQIRITDEDFIFNSDEFTIELGTVFNLGILEKEEDKDPDNKDPDEKEPDKPTHTDDEHEWVVTNEKNYERSNTDICYTIEYECACGEHKSEEVKHNFKKIELDPAAPSGNKYNEGNEDICYFEHYACSQCDATKDVEYKHSNFEYDELYDMDQCGECKKYNVNKNYEPKVIITESDGTKTETIISEG